VADITNIYCDESCHLEHDHQKVMVLGAVSCRLEAVRHIATKLKNIKIKYGLNPQFELKWGKVSSAKEKYYNDVINYFFDESELSFRALIVPNKALLRHEDFGQDHDTWYYKMYFTLLEPLLSPDGCYRIYLDKKDTRGGSKVNKLHDVLCNNIYDFNRNIIERVQIVTSNEVEQVQLCDLLIGAIGYANREITSSSAKLSLIEHIRQRTGYSLTRSTLLKERKVNIFCWQPREVL
jgi:hypothetical protein